MKIAYLSTFYPYRGGIAHFNTSLMKALQQHSEVRPYTFKRQYPDLLFPGETQYVTADDKVDVIHADRLLDTINPWTWRKTAKKISLYKPDILLMKYWMPFFSPSLGYVAGQLKKKGCKVISILDNVVPHERKFYDLPLSKYFLARNSAFIVMSDTVKNDLLMLNKEAKYLYHDHPLYDHFGKVTAKEEARNRLQIPADSKVLLLFGFVRDYKGLDLLIESMSLLPEDYYLIIAGEVYGDDKKYRERIKRLNLNGRIQANLRYISDEEVSLFFSAADVNVLPYRSATQSGILSIAYHFELPVIVTDTGSLKASVEPYQSGMVVPEADPHMIARAVLDYFADQKAADFIANIKKYKKQHSWAAMAEAILHFAEAIQG